MQNKEPHYEILPEDPQVAAEFRRINALYDDPNSWISANVFDEIVISCQVISMTEEEILITRWVELLNATGSVYENFYNGFMACMAYNGGAGSVRYIGGFNEGETFQHAKDAREAQNSIKYLKEKGFLKSRKHVCESAKGLFIDCMEKQKSNILGETLRRAMHGGSGWMSSNDVDSSGVFELSMDNPKALLLGALENYTFCYVGEQSLVTIAAPGSGKTQCHVLPALRNFQGSILALDIKGECYRATSHLRQGEVFLFAPYEPHESNHYNPLDFISRDPLIIWNDANVLASALIVADGHSAAHWDNRAKDLLAAFICHVVLTEPVKSMETVVDWISASPDDFGDLCTILQTAEVGGMRRAGRALATTLERAPKMLEGTLETMRGHLSVWEDDRLSMITRKSDWNPAQLRDEATTIYLCVPLEAVSVYASVLRVIIAQHLGALTPHDQDGVGEQNTLFLLDEVAQLGKLDAIPKAIEVGRGYGLRTWLFVQHIGQLRKVFGKEYADGMINTCGLVAYMNVNDDTAGELSRSLGEQHSLIHGEKTPLATHTDLTGPKFRDNIIIKSQGQYPALLDKYFFHQMQG